MSTTCQLSEAPSIILKTLNKTAKKKEVQNELPAVEKALCRTAQ